MEEEGLRALEEGVDVRYHPECADDRGALLSALRTLAPAALVVRNRVRVDQEVLEAGGGQLRVVGRLGSGLDNIDLHACAQRGVRVVDARGANADAVCEYVLAALWHLLRPLGPADAAVRAGGWPRQTFIGEELHGRTLGIVGLGAIGRRLAVRAAALGLTVWGHDPYVGAEAPELAATPVRWTALHELLSSAQILTVHVPLSPETYHLIDAAALARLPAGAIVINAARGGIVDEAALLHAVRSGHLRGAILDVREQEPPPQPDPLATLPGVLLTPHIAGWTREALTAIGQTVARQVLQQLAALNPTGGS